MARGHTETAFPDAHAAFACGRAGAPCRFGPDAAGRCAQRAECTPYRDGDGEGDRWLCDRPVGRGGPCAAGPLPDGECCRPATPCLPRMMPRRRFQVASRLTLALFIGAAFALLSSRDAMLPGAVLSAHAPFEGDCTQCHAAAPFAPAQVVAAAFTEHGITDSSKCLACHAVGDAPLAAHGVAGIHDAPPSPADDARAAPLGVRAASRIAPARLSHAGAAGQLACSTCHREHEGRAAPVATLSDAQCQVCHRRAFDGVAAHPSVPHWPHHAKPRVAFDHASHLRRHFPAAEKDGIEPPTRCASCHLAGRAGNFQPAGFAACAACHSAEITDPSGASAFLTFLAPPGLDLEALADAGIGAWPEYAEAAPTEFTRLQLRAGGYLSEADWALVASLDLLDLLDASRAEIAAAARFAWAFKALARDLVAEGPMVFAAIGARDGSGDAADRAASLPFEVAARAVASWFPHLDAELARHAAGAAVPTRGVDAGTDAAAPSDDWLRFGGWRAGELSLQYRPTGHADRFLRGWLDFADASGESGDALFRLLTQKDTPGRCAKCHANDAPPRAKPNDPPRLHWKARDNARAVLPISAAREWPHARRFSHRSHQNAINAGGCAACHALPAADRAASDASASGFAAQAIADCASCHHQDAALGECTTCHVYHFENFEPRLIEQQAGMMGKAR